MNYRGIFNNKTILVVEDTISNYILIEELLCDTGARIIIAVNGILALEICKSQHVDLVIMDIVLPIMDGIEVTKRLKKIRKELPVVAISAMVNQNIKQQCKRVGCNFFIEKPIYPNYFLKVISEILSN